MTNKSTIPLEKVDPKNFISLYMIFITPFYSSLIFLTNIIIAYSYEDYCYSVLFFMLLITSLIVHSNDNVYTNLIDKAVIFCIVFYGAYIFFNKCKDINSIYHIIFSIIIVGTFLLTVYLYCYGYFYKKYCFCEDEENAKLCHSFMHLVGSFGHNFIVLM